MSIKGTQLSVAHLLLLYNKCQCQYVTLFQLKGNNSLTFNSSDLQKFLIPKF